ncbi:MAG: hypothetical protein ACRCSN_04805 [Dermatophilaceae bacterium]
MGTTTLHTTTDILDVRAAFGKFVDDYDLDSIVRDYREAVQGALPEGYTLHYNGHVYRDLAFPGVRLDFAEIADPIDFWDIAERHQL